MCEAANLAPKSQQISIREMVWSPLGEWIVSSFPSLSWARAGSVSVLFCQTNSSAGWGGGGGTSKYGCPLIRRARFVCTFLGPPDGPSI